MNKCDCYCEEEITYRDYMNFTTYTETHTRCKGTKERDLCSCGGDRAKCNFYPEVREKALKEIEPKIGEWISVEDRLPKNKVNCIVYYKHSYCDDDGYYAVGVSFYDGYEFQIGLAYKVTYWMPLPAPPKEA